MAGRATGERIDGSKKRKVINLAANGATTNKIATTVNLDWSTVAAIEAFESKTIQERKTILAEQSATIATLAGERLKREVSTMPIGSLIPAFGVSIDKLCAITQEPQSQLNNHIHVHLDKVDLIGQFNNAMHQLQSNAAPTNNAPELSELHLPVQKQIKAKEIDSNSSADLPVDKS